MGGFLNRIRASNPAEEGATLLEFALVMPIFLLLSFGVFGFSIGLFEWCDATYAVQVGARYASLHSSASLNPATTASIQAAMQPFLYAVPSASTTTNVVYQDVNYQPSTNTIGNSVTVVLTVNYNPIMPYASSNAFQMGCSALRVITR